ncbi:lipoate--protein ligase family protein [Candidatus Dependentiae bacterium]|nr:lipoate--protein ligase family protein [Candidatus Dependentiae bacterium]
MNKEFRIIIDQNPNSSQVNMAVDEAIFLNYITAQNPIPVLRFYRWDPPAISIGYFQKPEDIDIESCKRMNIEFIRRPTGGRSVLHDNELTYSVIGGKEKFFENKSLIDIYSIISKALVKGLRKYGFEVEFKKPDYKNNQYHLKVLCFDSTSTFEITLNNKKVVGSAQVRKKGVFLQHGSIILSLDKEKVARLLKIKNIKLLEKASGLLDEMKIQNFEIERFISNLVFGFSEVFGMETCKSTLSEKEIDFTQLLIENKYSRASWNINAKEIKNEKVRI